MKRMLITLFTTIALACTATVASAATTIATVNMQKIFTTAPQVKKINTKLENQFSSRKTALLKEQKALQADVKRLEKNQAILKSSDLAKLQKKVTEKSSSFREKQAKFQQDLYTAQNEAMRDFMQTLNKAVESIAKRRGIDLVLPNNNLLYAKSTLDITSSVLKKLS